MTNYTVVHGTHNEKDNIMDIKFYTEHIAELTMCGLSKENQGTIIIRKHTDSFMYVETTVPSDFTIFRRNTINGDWKLKSVTTAAGETDPFKIMSAEFKAPKNLITFRSAKRTLTDEQRTAMTERLKRNK